MATSGTANEGLDEIADRTYISGADLTLVAYTNTPNSLEDTSVLGDISQPSQTNGYAPIVLDGTWSSADGVVTYVHSTPTHPTFLASGAWSGTVTGVAIVSGTSLWHFKDLDVPFAAADGRKLQIDLDTVVN